MSALLHKRPMLAAGIAAGCASLSGAALLFHAAGLVRMPFFITFFSVPAAMALLAYRVWLWRSDPNWLGQRLWAGCWIGFVGTLAYDGIRQLIVWTRLYSFNPFRIIVLLGTLITGAPESSRAAITAGWVYHFWNGISFGVLYVVAAGRGRWYWAVAWGLCLELVMLLTYPNLFGLGPWNWGFMGTSLIGHLAYGFTLGYFAQRQRLLPIPGKEISHAPAP